MKIRKPRLSNAFTALMACVVIGASTGHAGAQANVKKYVPGEVLVYCQGGTAQADVQALANKVGAIQIVPNLMPDVYRFILPAGQATDAGRLAAVALLKTDANVRWVDGNQIYQYDVKTVTPNDPMYGQQWALPQVNMPEAWVLQKGALNVEIADIDSGFDPQHEDLIGRYDLPNSYNWGDGNANIIAVSEDHGVSTSSIMIANTNNAIGMSGVDWQNILVVGEKVQQESTMSLTNAAILSAYADINLKYKKAHIVAVNMSYSGGGDPTDQTDPEYAALLQLSTDGLLLFASAGNSSADNHEALPCAYPFVTSVSAVNRAGVLTYYSSFGKVDITAPGGEQFSDTDPNGMVVAKLPSTNGGVSYAFEQGTSFSCPMVTAIAALLMSVPGVTSAHALQLIKSTANHTGLTTLPDSKYGYGIIDAYAALVQVSASVSITAPNGINPTTGVSSTGGSTSPPPVETKKPLVSFNVYGVPPASVTFTIDPGPSQISFTAAQLIASPTVPVTNVADVVLTGTSTGTNPQYSLAFRYTFGATTTATHTVQLTGINPANNQSVSDSLNFNVSPYVIPVDPSGVALVSFPYYEDAQDLAAAQAAGRGTLFNSQSVSLYRWLNVPQVVAGAATPVLLGEYAIYGTGHSTLDPGAPDPNSALSPSQYVPTLDPSSAGSVSPVGLAYFMKTPAPISFNTYGITYDNNAFSLPLHEGWNMIGDPYDFAVDFNSMEVQDLAGNRITTQAAADNNLILPHIYYYADGNYTFDSLPGGHLNPWQGHWIYVVPSNVSTLSDGVKLYLIVTPAAVAGTSKAVGVKATKTTTRGATSLATAPKAAGAGSWIVQLSAQTGSLHDNYNFIGESTRATMGMDSTKVPKPPNMSPFITLGVTHAAASNLGVLAQDLLPVGGTKQWTVEVTSDQKSANVTLTWPNITTVPRNYKLTLTDPVTGNTVNLRSNSNYQFVSGAANSTRSFTLVATPTNVRGHALVSNIVVNPSRTGPGKSVSSGTYEIGYNVSQDSQVDVSILGLNGHVLAEVSPSRAVSSGNNSVVWNGVDRTGHAVPAGSYVIQIRAVGPEGELTRQIVPFNITGR